MAENINFMVSRKVRACVRNLLTAVLLKAHAFWDARCCAGRHYTVLVALIGSVGGGGGGGNVVVPASQGEEHTDRNSLGFLIREFSNLRNICRKAFPERCTIREARIRTCITTTAELTDIYKDFRP